MLDMSRSKSSLLRSLLTVDDLFGVRLFSFFICIREGFTEAGSTILYLDLHPVSGVSASIIIGDDLLGESEGEEEEDEAEEEGILMDLTGVSFRRSDS